MIIFVVKIYLSPDYQTVSAVGQDLDLQVVIFFLEEDYNSREGLGPLCLAASSRFSRFQTLLMLAIIIFKT